MQRLRDKQEQRGEKRRPSGRKKRVKKEPREEKEPESEVEHSEGFYGVVLSRIGSRDRKNKAAKIVADVAGVHPGEARDMCEGTFVNVVRGVSEEEAGDIAAKFKEIGVTAKVTQQKKKKRQSGRARGRR